MGPPRHVQWLADPMWQRHHGLTPGTTTMVGARGRLGQHEVGNDTGAQGAKNRLALAGATDHGDHPPPSQFLQAEPQRVGVDAAVDRLALDIDEAAHDVTDGVERF